MIGGIITLCDVLRYDGVRIVNRVATESEVEDMRKQLGDGEAIVVYRSIEYWARWRAFMVTVVEVSGSGNRVKGRMWVQEDFIPLELAESLHRVAKVVQ